MAFGGNAALVPVAPGRSDGPWVDKMPGPLPAGARCKVQGARCKVQGARCKVQGQGSSAWGW